MAQKNCRQHYDMQTGKVYYGCEPAKLAPIADTLPTLPCALDSRGAEIMAVPLAEVIRLHLTYWSPAQIIHQDTEVINFILNSFAYPGLCWHGESCSKLDMETLKRPNDIRQRPLL